MWWLYGAALACTVAGLLLLAETLRHAGAVARADLLDLLRIGLYWAWAWSVWKCAPNVRKRVWTAVARTLALAGLGLMVLV